MLRAHRTIFTGIKRLAMQKAVGSFACADRVTDVSASVWVEFAGMAKQFNAVNIGQGFPDEPVPEIVIGALQNVAAQPEKTDWHQYTRGFGHPRLVNVLAKLYSELLQVNVNAEKNVLVTVGAYLSLYYAFLAWLNPGDEAIVLDPAFDCYVSQIRMAGGIPVPVLLELRKDSTTSADFEVNFKVLEQKIGPRTKMIVLNNPHNPTGKLFSRNELEGIAELVRRHNLIVVADEVYEWHVYGGKKMIRFASLPGMYERTITIGSAGKAFSVTGWKCGWSVAPEQLLDPMRRVHQNCVYTCPTPIQETVAQAFESELMVAESGSYLKTLIACELLGRRDRMASMLRAAGLKPIIPDSGYFMVADMADVDGPFRAEDGSGEPLDFRFARYMCREKKLAMIPNSAFYSDAFKKENDHFIRVCFFKSNNVMEEAEAILRNFSST